MENDEGAETDDEYFDRREVELNRLLGYKPTSLHDFARQPKHDFYGDLEFERHLYEEHAKRAANLLVHFPRVAQDLRKGIVRCPEGGCFLGDVFLFPLQPSGERMLAITNLVRGESRCGWLNWSFSENWRCMPVYLPASCRHGSARLRTGWLESIAALMEGWKHALATVEEDFAAYPEELKRGKASGIFHPPADVWRSKRRRAEVLQ